MSSLQDLHHQVMGEAPRTRHSSRVYDSLRNLRHTSRLPLLSERDISALEREDDDVTAARWNSLRLMKRVMAAWKRLVRAPAAAERVAENPEDALRMSLTVELERDDAESRRESIPVAPPSLSRGSISTLVTTTVVPSLLHLVPGATADPLRRLYVLAPALLSVLPHPVAVRIARRAVEMVPSLAPRLADTLAPELARSPTIPYSSQQSTLRRRLLLPGRAGLTNLGNTCYLNSVV